jgi:tetratricopeptide (TPR) repeat protein
MHNRRAAAWLLIAMLLASTSAFAVRRGRIIGKVVDPDGNPIEGVTVTATSPDVPDFNEIRTTDKKGVFKVDFEEINVVYQYRFDKVGYVTFQAEQTWEKDGSARYEFVMQPGETSGLQGPAPLTSSSPAIAAFNAGVTAFDAGEFSTSVTHFEEAIGHDPEFRRAWGALSVALVELDRFQEAAEAAEKAIELGSSHEMVLRARWDAYRNLGDEAKTAEALAAMEHTGRMAEEAKKVFNEGVGFFKAGDYENAFLKYQEAAAMNPNLDVALLGVATTGLKIGRIDEVMAATDAMLEENPSNQDAIRIRYNAALETGKEDLILDALVDLAAVDPETALNGLWMLAMASYDANDMERAKERFDKVLAVNPDHARAHYYLGLTYVSEGVNDKAKAHLQRFVEITPEDPDAATASELIDFLGSS